MKINLHLERLLLDGIPLGPGQRPLLQTAVETRLTRLLSNGGLKAELQSGGVFYNVRTAVIELSHDDGPARQGDRIAGAVYRGIGE